MFIALIAAPPGLLLLGTLKKGLNRFGARHGHSGSWLCALLAMAAGGIWYWATEPFEHRYGRSHLLAFAGLLVGLNLLWSSFLEGVRVPGRWSLRHGLSLACALGLSGTAFALPPTAATKELFHLERPSKWLGRAAAPLGIDADNDGWKAATGFLAGGDCDDSDPARHPGRVEVLGNGIDENCFAGDQTHKFVEYLGGNKELPAPKNDPQHNVVIVVLDSWRAVPGAPGGVAKSWTPNIASLSARRFSHFRTCAPRTRESLGDLLGSRLHPPLEANGGIKALTASGVYTADIASAWRSQYDTVTGWSEQRFAEGKYGDFDDAQVLALAEDFLTQPPQQPFFMVVHLLGAHEPYGAGSGCRDLDRPLERYQCAVRDLDTRTGQLFSRLKAQGLSEETVFVVTADHGEEFGEHQARFHANTVYDEVLHVPLLMVVPGQPASLEDGPVSCFDFLPTVLGAAGMKIDGQFAGGNFSHLAPPKTGTQFARTRTGASASVFEPRHYAVVHRGYKLHFDQTTTLRRYYNLEQDPKEQSPLSSAPPKIQTALLARMDAWLSEQSRSSEP